MSVKQLLKMLTLITIVTVSILLLILHATGVKKMYEEFKKVPDPNERAGMVRFTNKRERRIAKKIIKDIIESHKSENVIKDPEFISAKINKKTGWIWISAITVNKKQGFRYPVKIYIEYNNRWIIDEYYFSRTEV